MPVRVGMLTRSGHCKAPCLHASGTANCDAAVPVRCDLQFSAVDMTMEYEIGDTYMQSICAERTRSNQGSGLPGQSLSNPWRSLSGTTTQQLIVTSLGYCSAIASSNAPIAGGATGGEIRGGEEKKREKKGSKLGHTTRLVQPCPPHRVSRLPVDGS